MALEEMSLGRFLHAWNLQSMKMLDFLDDFSAAVIWRNELGGKKTKRSRVIRTPM